MLLLSTATMQNWVWEGNTILADNILNNVAWRCILCLLSAYQIYLCHEVDQSNALYLMVISVTCQRIQFNIYKVVEAILLGYIFLDGPAPFPLVKDIVGYLKMCHSILPIKR